MDTKMRSHSAQISPDPSGIKRRSFVIGATALATHAFLPSWTWAQPTYRLSRFSDRFTPVAAQYIAALGNNDAHSGNNAQSWGLWPVDPGPRGVRLRHFDALSRRGVAPAGWTFDANDWWLEEHGLIMEQPEFPLPSGEYLVTGARDVTTALHVGEKLSDGSQSWELEDRANLYDVTHLRCRSARYRHLSSGTCSPAQARQTDFPVAPGEQMPPVEGCSKQDYAVLIVIGIGRERSYV